MKLISAFLCLLPSVISAANVMTPFAIETRSRNSLGSNYAANYYSDIPPGGAPGLMLFTGSSEMECVMLGTGLSWTPRNPGVSHGVLNVTASQVQSDWNATTGLGVILNKPALFDGTWGSLSGKPSFSTVATTGAYADLSGLPTLFNGAYSSLTGTPTLGTAASTSASDYATAAQGVKADSALQAAAIGVSVQAYNSALTTFASNGSAFYLSRANHTGTQSVSTITGLATVATSGAYADLSGKPTLGTAAATSSSDYATAAQGALAATAVQPAALSAYATTSALTSGLAGKFNTPSGTTAQYLRGDGSLQTFPSIPAAQVQSDWTAVSGLGVILNKPTLGTAAAQNTSAFDAAGAATAAQAFAIQRSNHTGTQAISTVTGLQSALDAKFAIPAGTTSQYVRGDGTLATYSGLAGVTAPITSSSGTIGISAATTSAAGSMSATDKTKLDGLPVTYRAIGTVSGGAGRVTFTYPSFGAGVVPVVQAVVVKPTGATVSYNAAIYGDPTDTSCTVEANTVNPTILGILGSILIAQPAPNGTKVHLVVTAP